jgi:phosphohistidine swiveling domain-containing protein
VTWVRRLVPDDEAIGGKARSLARLAALGLPVPAGFALSTAVMGDLRARRPPPLRLSTAADLAALDEARAAVAAAPFSAALEGELAAALRALASADAPDVTFAVRSSAPDEDGADGAAPGLFDSFLRVRRDDVVQAVRSVLASALSPAAWGYALRSRSRSQGEMAVLVHAFLDGSAHGAASCEPNGNVRLDAHEGAPTSGARATIEEAVTRAAARFGAVELEWVATGDDVTFLQLRPHRVARRAAPLATPAVREAERDGWTWDAAHNPAPLSPAQAGLVAWVDERCAVGFRQRVRVRVIDGYLFFKRPAEAFPPSTVAGSPRILLELLETDVAAALARLGPAPRLQGALELYGAAYERLFGVVQPACAAARAALKAFLATSGAAASPAALVGTDVPSAATRRRAAARAIGAAVEPAARQAAITAYVDAFGDESPRWDVAEPTLRETPERLLLVGGGAVASAADGRGAHLPSGLSAAARAELERLLVEAREAAAVAEDDDALFARLQAVVRRALLTLGQRLLSEGRLKNADDVFFLPLALARALDDDATGPSELVAVAAAGRAAFAEAVAHPPVPPEMTGGAVVKGASGSAGRVLGHVVLHPSSTPLGPGAVLVAATLLPTELPLLDAAALVVETGSPLGHVAAQARERGIPAVVGAHGARAALRDGQRVLVDGDRGEVVLLTED